jgi:hypothetical protein
LTFFSPHHLRGNKDGDAAVDPAAVFTGDPIFYVCLLLTFILVGAFYGAFLAWYAVELGFLEVASEGRADVSDF